MNGFENFYIGAWKDEGLTRHVEKANIPAKSAEGERPPSLRKASVRIKATAAASWGVAFSVGVIAAGWFVSDISAQDAAPGDRSLPDDSLLAKPREEDTPSFLSRSRKVIADLQSGACAYESELTLSLATQVLTRTAEVSKTSRPGWVDGLAEKLAKLAD